MSTEPVPAPVPQGDYVAAVCHGGVVYTAGMTPRVDGRLTLTGVVGADVTVEQAADAAGLAVRNALAAARRSAGAPLARCLKMTVFVACTPDFHALSRVADGASAVIRAEFGAERGQAALPARSAIGVQSLPSGAPVEVELVVAVTSDLEHSPSSPSM